METEFTKYERARIIGARGLQISMDAPLLKKFTKEELENLNFDPLKIAEVELDSGVLPITVNKPLPKKREEDVEKLKIESDVSDEEKERLEQEEEKEIAKSGEIIELANEDEEEEIEEEPNGGETETILEEE